jgi:hypothetical protein
MAAIRYQERHMYTPEQVREHLTDALNLVVELETPSDLRVAVFQAALNLFSNKNVTAEAIGMGTVLDGYGRPQ